jgi:hypothetical protein
MRFHARSSRAGEQRSGIGASARLIGCGPPRPAGGGTRSQPLEQPVANAKPLAIIVKVGFTAPPRGFRVRPPLL